MSARISNIGWTEQLLDGLESMSPEWDPHWGLMEDGGRIVIATDGGTNPRKFITDPWCLWDTPSSGSVVEFFSPLISA